MPSTDAKVPAPSRAALSYPDFRRYLGSSLSSNLAAQMLAVAVGWQVYSSTHRAMALGYVGLAQFVPAFGLSLVAGGVADRFDRARIVAVCNLAQAGCAFALAALSLGTTTSVAPMYLALFCLGCAQAFEGPAGQALVPGLVAQEHFANAVTWSSTVWQASTIVGPALGGIFYGVVHGPEWVYCSCAALFALAGVLAFALDARPSVGASVPSASIREGVLGGLRFVRRRPVLLEALSLDLFAVFLGGATALLPIYASDVLHVGARGLGLLRSAPAVGATLMALVVASRPLKRNAGPTMLGCVAVFGAATVVFGVSRHFVLSLGALALLGASDMVSVVVRSTVVQLRTPDAMRGRVSAVAMLCIAASSHLGELESGLTAAWLGAVPAVILGGCGTLAIVATYTFWFRGLRGIDRLDEATEPQ